MNAKRVLWSGWLLCVAGAASAGAPISPDALAREIAAGKAPRVLDVRSAEEFAQGHVPGAILIPHDQLASRIGELGKAGEIVVYCRSGRRAGLVRPLLDQAGFDVHEMEGSFNAWQAAQLPVTTVAQ